MGTSTSEDAVKLLWSGGWDSTFRLLQLLLIEKKVVKPYYLIDPHRESFAVEINTMREIKNKLFERFPETQDRLLPTYICEIYDVKENPAITKHFQAIQEKYAFGAQYEWLAKFADEHKLYNIEMSWEQRRHLPAKREIILPVVYPSKHPDVKIDPDIYEIFKFYTFPVSNIYKKDMMHIAKKSGFYDLMQLTWSCHRPTWRRRPCGLCVPCRDVMETKMGHRLPFISKVKYYIFKPIIGTKNKYPRVYRLLKKARRPFSAKNP